ncbi:hypothetical protein JL2886_03815 [Phaeobacter gallaeciensis]|uniref:Uncharacterized protein n=1 Tax=Phaeobacter gallaeciensis TaxID=60890 RepID=A0A1B0ZX60_9RHOB|nr:hypothetical protein JL2886_03815 [Phaeobacter gallaeciensis]
MWPLFGAIKRRASNIDGRLLACWRESRLYARHSKTDGRRG